MATLTKKDLAPPARVMRVISRLNVGGPAVHCLLLSKSLARQGFECTLVAGLPEAEEADYEAMFDVKTEGFTLVRLRRLRRSITGFGDLATLWQLYRLMRRERPRIVHTHTTKAGLLGRVAAYFAGVPIVVHTFHGHVLSGYFSPRISRLVRHVEWLLARKTSALITLSPGLREELSVRFRVADPQRFRVIPLGRDLAPFRDAGAHRGELRRELGLTDPKMVVIGTVGRLVPIKDQQLLLRACALLDPAIPWRLLVVGEGDLRPELEALASSLGLADRVHFVGWRSDLPRVYASLDVFTLCSRNEGTPLSIIESFASGCPVVSTRVGGVADMFSAAECGTAPSARVELRAEGALVPAGDAEALAIALEYYLADPEARKRAAVAARRSAEGFTDDALTERMAALYHELLSGVPR